MSVPAFAELLERLVFTPGRLAKIALLKRWFAEQPDPGRVRRLEQLGRVGLADGQQPHLRRVAPRGRAGLVDLPADAGEVRGDVDHGINLGRAHEAAGISRSAR